MYNFQYVTKRELSPIKKEIIYLIRLVQNEVRNKFTFQYKFVGSVKRNMVTYDVKSNVGFDFDINIVINDDDEQYSAKEIKHILMNAFNKFSCTFHFGFCKDNTRVFTIKVKDTLSSKILYSCDFAIVHDYGENQQEYIRFNKNLNSYTWEEQSMGFYRIPEKIEFCKRSGLWQEVRNTYIDKKNTNKDKNKKSRSVFAETIHQLCQQNGYY